MKGPGTEPRRSSFVLPLPGFIFKPYTAVLIAAVHVYLGAGHLSKLFGGDVQWTHIWKGFGALGGAYVFAALASRRIVWWGHRGRGVTATPSARMASPTD